MKNPLIDYDLIDDTVLALLFLTLHDIGGMHHAWKSFDWEAMGRLHAKGFILDPIGKAKSVTLTEEGRKKSEEAFYRFFSRGAEGKPGI